VQPIQLAPGVRTIGELELIDHLERGLPIVDTRQPDFYRGATVPGARGIPHEQILEHPVASPSRSRSRSRNRMGSASR